MSGECGQVQMRWRASNPGDLRALLDAGSEARRQWDALRRSARRGETRARQVRGTVEPAAQGVRTDQWRPR